MRGRRERVDYVSGLRRALADNPPRWDFYNGTFLTMMVCTAEEQTAIYEYQVDLHRRAWAMVDQPHTADVSHAQVEARADR